MTETKGMGKSRSKKRKNTGMIGTKRFVYFVIHKNQ